MGVRRWARTAAWKGCCAVSLVLSVWGLASCSPTIQITIHDEDRAALVASNFLHLAFCQRLPGLAYDGTHAQFKAAANREAFVGAMEKLRSSLAPTNLVITDYSTWGTEEIIGIYGTSQTSAGALLYLRCLLAGTQLTGYAVNRLDWSTKLPKKTGANVPFKTPIVLPQAPQAGAEVGSPAAGGSHR